MRDYPRRRRDTPDPGTNRGPEAGPKGVGRSDRSNTPPDSLPHSDYEREINRLDAAIAARIA